MNVENELRIALTQLLSSKDKSENLLKIEKYISKAVSLKSDLVVFPEGYMFYSSPGDDPKIRSEKSESIDGPFVKAISSMARKYGLYVVFGMNEKIPGELKTYNTIVAIDNNGEIVNIYRKTHLYDAFTFKESDLNIPHDNKLKVFDIKNFKAGVMVCYEVRFPEIARTLALKGADLIIIPSAWVSGYNKEDIWLSTIKTRAMENTVFIGTSNQIGNIYTGISSFVDPLGILITRANEQEGLITGVVSKERLEYARNLLPLLSQRRRELYEL